MIHHDGIITDSEFNMWRALFAFMLSDNFLSVPEQEVFRTYASHVPFSAVQREVLRRDFIHPRNVEDLHKRITSPADRKRFCELARIIAWSEGDLDLQDKIILQKLSCLDTPEGRDFLHQSRTSETVTRYREHYESAEKMAFFKPPPIIEIRV